VIGPRAPAVIRPYLDRPADAPRFSPQESEEQRKAARVVLGHATANVTQIYAETDLEMAKKIAREIG
jgi:hypothetical protein